MISEPDGSDYEDSPEEQRLLSLNFLLVDVANYNAFYRPRLRKAGMMRGAASIEDFIRRMPFTTKQELVDDRHRNPPYGSNLTYPIDRYTRFSQTSGTSGEPMRWLDTEESWEWMVWNWVAVLENAGVEDKDRIFFAFSFGPFIGFWLAFEAAAELGCLCIPGGGMTSAARLQAILDNEATILCCTPTYAIRLAEVAREEGIDLSRSRIRRIIVAGEPGASIPATRRRIEEGWPGAKVFDHHGMTEVGPVSYECPALAGVLHVIESAFIAEVIDPETTEAVEPGNPGELVLTSLGRKASPVIRYRTGDLVRQTTSRPCACGRTEMALEGGILGRTDDMVVVRGVNLYPSAVEDVIRRFPEVAEYRVEVFTASTMPEARIELEPAPHCPDSALLKRQVESALRTTFNLRIPVSIAPPDTLPRFEFKANRWTRKGEDTEN